MRARAAIGWLHRWVGLVTAGFLLIAGLSGALLAWYEELDAWLDPALLTVPPPSGGQAALDPPSLQARVQAAYPGHWVNHVPLSQPHGRAAVFYAVPRPERLKGTAPAVVQVHVNPFSGEVLGDRVTGELRWGARHLMPFVYRLHHSLALGLFGTVALGAVSVLWTLDCFFGFWLSLPARAREARAPAGAVAPRASWLRRWAPAWRVRWRAGGHKRTHDLHRAGGLWLWAMLFVFAWSSVAFNLTPAYDTVMRPWLSFQSTVKALPVQDTPQWEAGMDWARALATGRALMQAQAREHGFRVEREDLLFHDPWRGVFSYYVRSSLDVRERVGRTLVAFDANTGALRTVWLPTGAASGDTITSWIGGLHMAALWGWPFQAFVSLAGLGVGLLSLTGVLIWKKKADARRAAGRLRRPGTAQDARS